MLISPIFGKGGEDFFSEFFGCFQVVGVDDIQVDLFSKAVCNVIFDGFSHSAFCLGHGAGLGEGVQLFALDLQNRFQTEHGSEGCSCRSDAAALFQVLQSSYSDIDAGVEAGFSSQVPISSAERPFLACWIASMAE